MLVFGVCPLEVRYWSSAHLAQSSRKLRCTMICSIFGLASKDAKEYPRGRIHGLNKGPAQPSLIPDPSIILLKSGCPHLDPKNGEVPVQVGTGVNGRIHSEKASGVQSIQADGAVKSQGDSAKATLRTPQVSGHWDRRGQFGLVPHPKPT